MEIKKTSARSVVSQKKYLNCFEIKILKFILNYQDARII